jgi:hypothetical protein
MLELVRVVDDDHRGVAPERLPDQPLARVEHRIGLGQVGIVEGERNEQLLLLIPESEACPVDAEDPAHLADGDVRQRAWVEQ